MALNASTQVAEKNGNAMDDDHENVLNVNSLPACYALVTSGIPAQHVCYKFITPSITPISYHMHIHGIYTY